MRFHADGPALPDTLLEQCDAGRVVFLCGAGVSMPDQMPSFVELARDVIHHFDPPERSKISEELKPWLDGCQRQKTPLDRIFSSLHELYGREQVDAQITKRLSIRQGTSGLGSKHALLKRISSSRRGNPQIVTTNFDTLFECNDPDVHVNYPTALPRVACGASVEGITYLHGRLADPGYASSSGDRYILSSEDLGRAYLSDGWAAAFVRDLLRSYTVVAIGYSGDDPPVEYLFRGLKESRKQDDCSLYVFDKEQPEDTKGKWQERGAAVIVYREHEYLWQTMEAWAARADDPRRWKAAVVYGASRDPKAFRSHERGQVAHVLRSVQGARLLSQAGRTVHPEWVCVMDSEIRAHATAEGLSDRNDRNLVYGLDDDQPGVRGDNLLSWLPGDSSPCESHSLGGKQVEGLEALPKRLKYIANWLRISLNSPPLAWWAARQTGLHPRLQHNIVLEILNNPSLHVRAHHVWNLILEGQRDRRSWQAADPGFLLDKRIAQEGWSAGVLRDFRRASRPSITIKAPYGQGGRVPPDTGWDDIRIERDIGRFEFEFLDRSFSGKNVPDVVLSEVLKILEDHLLFASGLLTEVTDSPLDSRIRTPTCYPGRDADGQHYYTEEKQAAILFRELFDRVAESQPDLARAHAVAWSASDAIYFRKLKLYSLSFRSLFSAHEAADTLLSIGKDAFWDQNVARELLFLLVDRWSEYSRTDRSLLTERVLEGPSGGEGCTADSCPEMKALLTARYGRYLQLHGCDLTSEYNSRLAAIVAGIEGWKDEYAESVVTEPGVISDWIRFDPSPDVLLGIPEREIVAKVRSLPQLDFRSSARRAPFSGLVKERTRKALAALSIEGRKGEHPADLWPSMIKDFPHDAPHRLTCVFMRRIEGLPDDVIAESADPLGIWLDKCLTALIKFDKDLAWSVYDRVAGSIHSARQYERGGAEVRQPGDPVKLTRGMLSHAINTPLGNCASALFKAVLEEARNDGSPIPCHLRRRLDRLFAAPHEGSGHAVAVAMRRLGWLIEIDPDWTRKVLLPMLDLDHPCVEPAWSGFLEHGDSLTPVLADAVKPQLLNLHRSNDRVRLDGRLSVAAGRLLAEMRINRPGQRGGLNREEMKSALRDMGDFARNSIVGLLTDVGNEGGGKWKESVIPFIEESWPNELRSESATVSWLKLLHETGDSFPAVYEVVKWLLVPMEINGYLFNRFNEPAGGGQSITARFPDAMLDLSNRVTPDTVVPPNDELHRTLDLIVEIAPSLSKDARFLRLTDLFEGHAKSHQSFRNRP